MNFYPNQYTFNKQDLLGDKSYQLDGTHPFLPGAWHVGCKCWSSRHDKLLSGRPKSLRMDTFLELFYNLELGIVIFTGLSLHLKPSDQNVLLPCILRLRREISCSFSVAPEKSTETSRGFVLQSRFYIPPSAQAPGYQGRSDNF